jgi:uncharacterized protein YecA (UPF0149 family)
MGRRAKLGLTPVRPVQGKRCTKFVIESDGQVRVEEIDFRFNVYRNHKCPCGSGKKFKKCCIGETL